MHCAKYGWNRPSGSGEEAFYISSMYFCYLIIISPWEKVWPFIGRNLNPLYPRPKIKISLFDVGHRPSEKPASWVFLVAFCRILFFFFSDIFCFPSPKNALCQIWLKLGQWFWRRRFLNFVNIFSLFRYYLPLENNVALHLIKLDSPSPKDPLF